MTIQAMVVILASWMAWQTVPSSSLIQPCRKTSQGSGSPLGRTRRTILHDPSVVCLFEQKRRGVGDVVQGLHGGKYQFDDPTHGSLSSSSFSALPTFEGRHFAETGYGSSSSSSLYDDDDESTRSTTTTDSLDEEPLPHWATQLVQLPLPDNSPELILDEGGREIQIQNEERSWEVYYAFVVGPLSETKGRIVIEPRVGQLAPRGVGVGPFSDTAILKVQYHGPWSSSTGMEASGPPSWLVVGTEAARWFYRLQTTMTTTTTTTTTTF
jgi:hypothetical protein